MAPGIGFAVGIQRLIPFIGYHHILMILIAIAIILLCEFGQAPSLSTTTKKHASQHYYSQDARPVHR